MTYKPPKDMPLRQARKIAQQMDLDFCDQYKNIKLVESI